MKNKIQKQFDALIARKKLTNAAQIMTIAKQYQAMFASQFGFTPKINL